MYVILSNPQSLLKIDTGSPLNQKTPKFEKLKYLLNVFNFHGLGLFGSIRSSRVDTIFSGHVFLEYYFFKQTQNVKLDFLNFQVYDWRYVAARSNDGSSIR